MSGLSCASPVVRLTSTSRHDRSLLAWTAPSAAAYRAGVGGVRRERGCHLGWNRARVVGETRVPQGGSVGGPVGCGHGPDLPILRFRTVCHPWGVGYYINPIMWALAISLSLVAGIWTFYAYRRRGLAAAARGAAFVLLPFAALFTGTLDAR